MPADRAVLTIECGASLLVAELADLLGSLDAAYEGVFAFEAQLTEVAEYTRRWRRAVPFELLPGPWGWGGQVPLAPAHVLVAAPDRLFIEGVQLSSPGLVKVLGALNPLESIRKGLNDRHERRKDREYREAAEKQRLDVENQIREEELRKLRTQNDLADYEALARITGIARENGVPESQITALWNQYAVPPLQRFELVAVSVDATTTEIEQVAS